MIDLTASPVKRTAEEAMIDSQSPDVATSKRKKTALVRVESSEMVSSTQLQKGNKLGLVKRGRGEEK